MKDIVTPIVAAVVAALAAAFLTYLVITPDTKLGEIRDGIAVLKADVGTIRRTMAKCTDLQQVYYVLGFSLRDVLSEQADEIFNAGHDLVCETDSASNTTRPTVDPTRVARLGWPVRRTNVPEGIERTSHPKTHDDSIVFRYPSTTPIEVQAPELGRILACTEDITNDQYEDLDIYELTFLSQVGDKIRIGNLIGLEPHIQRLCEAALAGKLRQRIPFFEQIVAAGEKLATIVSKVSRVHPHRHHSPRIEITEVG